MRNATGATRRNMSKACGESCSTDEGDDFVLATNETHTVREFAEAAFAHVDLDWKEFVKHDPRYERPAEVDMLIGDPAKAKADSGLGTESPLQELVANHGRRRSGNALAADRAGAA